MRNRVFAIVAVALVGLAAWWYLNQNSNTTTNTTPAPGATNSAETAVQGTPAATITYNGSVFSPSQVSVRAGQTVAVKNASGVAVEFNSNPHPTHTNNSELNVGFIPVGETMTVTLTRTGTWGYHNHLSSTQGGTIVVTP